MNELIKVQHNEDGTVAVSGRELHEFLEIKTQYSTWFNNMKKYDLVENRDYVAVIKKIITAQGNESSYIDHALTIETAKELAMIQRNDKGKQARRYFIEVEKKFKQGVQQVIAQPDNKELSISDRLKMMELIVNAPDGVAETVSALAKPFIKENSSSQNSVKTPVSVIEMSEPDYPRVPVAAPVPSPESLPFLGDTRSAAGYSIPFNHRKLKRHLDKMCLPGYLFAKQTGIPVASMRHYLSGKSRPGEETRVKICRALCKPNNWLNN